MEGGHTDHCSRACGVLQMSSPHRYRVAGPRRIGMLSFMRGIRRRTIRRTATYLPVRARAGRDPLRDVGTSMFLATNSHRLLVLVRAVLITLLIRDWRIIFVELQQSSILPL